MFTGFMCKKFMWPECNQYLEKNNPNCWWDYRFLTIYIRASQIYLDYAEALFEVVEVLRQLLRDVLYQLQKLLIFFADELA